MGNVYVEAATRRKKGREEKREEGKEEGGTCVQTSHSSGDKDYVHRTFQYLTIIWKKSVARMFCV
jgi:predicted transposase YdaD